MSIAGLIQTSRQRQHLSQAELAARSGTSQATLSRYERGDAIPTIATLERLLAATGSTLELRARPSSRTLDVRTERLAKLRSQKTEIVRLARSVGASNVAVFGSVARGTDSESSDIDLLVDFDAAARGMFPIFNLEERLTDLLGETVDVAVRQLLKPAVAATALVEEVPL
ncbi:MAG: helix-turn-helix domain-containing protein [Microbacteriaceae bacterium]